jgi:hypothetical protein
LTSPTPSPSFWSRRPGRPHRIKPKIGVPIRRQSGFGCQRLPEVKIKSIPTRWRASPQYLGKKSSPSPAAGLGVPWRFALCEMFRLFFWSRRKRVSGDVRFLPYFVCFTPDFGHS